jgi:hypothetical protein
MISSTNPYRSFQLSLMFVGRPAKHLKCGKSPSLVSNIRLGRKGLPGSNTLAYYKHLKMTVVKIFLTLVQRSKETVRSANLITRFDKIISFYGKALIG